MRSAIDLNNKACSLIDINLLDEAVESLSKALSLVQNDVHEIEEGGSENASKLVKTDCPKGCAKVCPSNKKLKRRKELDGLESFMYHNALYVHQIPSVQEHRFLSVVIIFNFALCYHLMALQATDQKAKADKLNAALSLYEVAVTMQMEPSFHVHMETMATYFMAMVNNSAHIYELLDRPHKAQQFRNQMLSSIMVMIEKGEAHNLDEFEGFFQISASKTILKKTNFAAAA